MFKQMKKAKNEILLMAILFSLFFIMLFYDEKTAVLTTFPCLFSLFAKNLFTKEV